MTGAMNAKQNQNASSGKRHKTAEEDGDSAPWSRLTPDILFLIIMRLGLVDFTAFAGVCKSWKEAAIANKDMFIMSRQPMSLRVSIQVPKKKKCVLQDSEGRRFKTILPRTSGRMCLGFASGYLIFFGKQSNDFRLVNLITKHELQFPRCPFHVVPSPDALRCTLVFSPTMFDYVFVISDRFSRTIAFSLPGKRSTWTQLYSNSPICDLQFHKGKIYALTIDLRLFEVRLNPKQPEQPSLKLLNMKNHVSPHIVHPKMFAPLGERLILYNVEDLYGAVEVDFDQMEWVMSPVISPTDYVCYISILKGRVTKGEYWEVPHAQYAKFGNFHGTCKNKNRCIRLSTTMWLFPDKCFRMNLLNE